MIEFFLLGQVEYEEPFDSWKMPGGAARGDNEPRNDVRMQSAHRCYYSQITLVSVEITFTRCVSTIERECDTAHGGRSAVYPRGGKPEVGILRHLPIPSDKRQWARASNSCLRAAPIPAIARFGKGSRVDIINNLRELAPFDLHASIRPLPLRRRG